ncbi:hypothetical protein D9V66_00395 [Buchnera aphidicola (Brevicoryne brassicae)]|uniref:hypothetical protein n=1 Tax=Buchnera aphidicola TaxID=9 RepID=UPI0010C44589|nr:hypothetical protein [Buchnera aphidicola]QCI19659.1 hypothetical protein D9V66_00395 [Buchnera aphidicola (Brevicoryne brassicae)]
MLKIIYNILPYKNVSSNLHEKNNIFDINSKLPVSQSIFNELNKFLINKEIEFDNVSTDEKKHDKNIICTNFAINNLLNIVVYKDQLLKFSVLSDLKDNIKDNRENRR